MSFGNIPEHTGEWLRGSGPESDIVVSTRIRLARNLAGFNFVSRADAPQQREVLDRCKKQILDCRLDDAIIWVDLDDCTSLDRQILVERHLISNQLARPRGQTPRGVAVGGRETFSIMVNEEDHLRIQVLRSGIQIQEAFAQINRLDDVLQEHLPFAFSPRFGYLTACPTNVGTGIRVSAMLHLPALKLTGEIEKVKRAAKELHLAIRGLFGEGSDAHGDLYQVSNQITLGRSEMEILADFEHTILPQIIAYEQQARQALLRDRTSQLDDRIWRAWGTLTTARLIGTEEVLTQLSQLRMGLNMGRIRTVGMQTLNELFLLCQPAHLQRVVGQQLSQAQRREARATLIRQRLSC